MDLVEKLRTAADARRRDPAQYLINAEIIAILLREAADEIDDLRQQIPAPPPE